MKSTYSTISTKKTSQSAPAKKTQVKNSAGGYVFAIDKFTQLERFLILGSEGGTYYIGEQKLTLDNFHSLTACLSEDYRRTVDAIADVSSKGRAVKNDPAIFALAAAASFTDHPQALDVRHYALSRLPDVCRIPTHLFHFLGYLRQFRGLGRSVRTAVRKWYASFTDDKLAYELVKYQSRDGMSNRDLLRLCHPKLDSPAIRWAVNGAAGTIEHRVTRRLKGWSKASPLERIDTYKAYDALPRIIDGFELAKTATTAKEIVGLIDEYRLTHEMIPTQFKSTKEVQAALLPHMPLGALVRNLGNLSKSGLMDPYSPELAYVCTKLTDSVYIRNSRLHPLSVLIAQKVYGLGHGIKGKSTWSVNPDIMDALNDAFYKAFDNATPTGKRLLFALDVSGSMGTPISAEMPITSAEAGTALIMLAIQTEAPTPYVKGFASKGIGGSWASPAQTDFRDLHVTKKMLLPEALKHTTSKTFGATDCAMPAAWAADNHIELDGIVIITDNETWAGTEHPFQALTRYRNKMGIPLRQVVIGTTATEFTIADPTDLLSLDVVGFDASAPPIISSFLRGEL